MNTKTGVMCVNIASTESIRQKYKVTFSMSFQNDEEFYLEPAELRGGEMNDICNSAK